MWVVVTLIVLAVVFGLIGFLVEAAAWALVIALGLIVAGALAGFVGRGRTRST